MTLYSSASSPSFSRRKHSQWWSKVRSDSAIEEEIYERLAKENLVAFSPDHINVNAQHGQVQLTGYAASEWQRRLAEIIAAPVEGVTGVRNEILLDEEVSAQVLLALAEDPRTTAYLITVTCRSGWVHLDGMLPTLEAAQAVEEVAASVSAVRGILSVPWVMGLPWLEGEGLAPVRRAFQPMHGATVYNGNEAGQTEDDGLVTQIILDPISRLLSHVVVQIREQKEAPTKERRIREHVVPVSAIEAANRGQVWLKAGKEIKEFPSFQPAQYPLAGQDWKPPFPYQGGTVRLSR